MPPTTDRRPRAPLPIYYPVSPEYFRTMEIPLLAGRTFTEQDTDGAPRVVVINRTFADRIFPGENPIGQRIRLGRNSSIVREIVGVVANTKHYGLGEQREPLQVYEPFAQMSAGGMEFVLRTSVEPASLAGAVRREVQAVDADQPITGLQTLEQTLAQSVAHPRFRTLLLGLFGGLALASVGVYGVIIPICSQSSFQLRRKHLGVKCQTAVAHSSASPLLEYAKGCNPVHRGLLGRRARIAIAAWSEALRSLRLISG